MKELKPFAVLVDIFFVFLSFEIACFLITEESFSFKEYSILMFCLPFIWYICLNKYKLYEPVIIKNTWSLLSSLIKANFVGCVILAFIFFIDKLTFPDFFQLMQISFFFLLNLLFLFIVKKISIRKNKSVFTNLLFVGINEDALKLTKFIQDYPSLGYSITGVLVEQNSEFGDIEDSIPKILGKILEIEKVLRENPIDEVISFLPPEHREVSLIANICKDMGVRFSTIPPHWNELKTPNILLHKIAAIPILSFIFNPFDEWKLFFKRLIDIVISASLLILSAPLFLVIAIAIKLDSEGPVFYVQERCGLNGRIFPMLKFRSMVVGADKMKEELRLFNEMSGPVFKMKDDPRVTRVGRWLRKTSLDELPQLINVLKGDMSLVGPRPPLPEEVKQYERWQMRRLSVKPGITCIWQISGRNEIDFDEWVRLDLYYIDHWSLSLDLKILIRTIPAVITGRGAR